MNRGKHISLITHEPMEGAGGGVCVSLKAMLMQKLAWLIIASYALLLLQPVMPVLMDVVAHTFWEQQHMLTVHEEHGKFHVQQEVVKAGHHNHKHMAEMSREEVVACLAEAVGTNEQCLNFLAAKKVYYSYCSNYPSSAIDRHYPPPKV